MKAVSFCNMVMDLVSCYQIDTEINPSNGANVVLLELCRSGVLIRYHAEDLDIRQRNWRFRGRM